jgi:hypothetical protein
LSKSTYEVAHPHTQSVGNDLERVQRHTLKPVFNPVEVHAIQASQFCKLILRDSSAATDCPDSLPYESVYVLQNSGYGDTILLRTLL